MAPAALPPGLYPEAVTLGVVALSPPGAVPQVLSRQSQKRLLTLIESCRSTLRARGPLKPFLFEPPEEKQSQDDKNDDDDPVVDAQDLRQGDLPQISPGKDRRFQGRIGLGKNGGPREHPQDTPKAIPSTLPQCPGRGPWAVAEQTPSHSEDKAAQDIASQNRGFYGELDQTKIQEEINTDHTDQDAREHEFDDGHIQESEGTDLLVVSNDPGLLHKEAKEYAGYKTVNDCFHS